MRVPLDKISEAVVSTWQSLFGMAITGSWSASEIDAPDLSVISCINLSGEEQISVTIECPRSLAGTMAGVMFDADPKELSDSDVDDAVGELANVLAGELSERISGDYDLSLPTVIGAETYDLCSPQGELVVRGLYEADGQKFVISLYSLAASCS